eukprot:TRINITY_DN6515_c0_g1_i1.p1 TRINITY_DN6515_c0_g1~~TRINITY_DN6515_c0_g1_i1.p1  ORF type:complete len:608 (+),score=133.72 TRINITY_DN6515_c0_g1_i1:221-2044(+)
MESETTITPPSPTKTNADGSTTALTPNHNHADTTEHTSTTEEQNAPSSSTLTDSILVVDKRTMTTNDQEQPQQQQQQHQQPPQAQHEIYSNFTNNYGGSSSSSNNSAGTTMSTTSHNSESPVRSQQHLPHLQEASNSTPSSASSNNTTTSQSSPNTNPYFATSPHLHPLQQLPRISQLSHHPNNLLQTSPSSAANNSSAHFGSTPSSTYANYSPPPMLEHSGLPPPQNARELASFCYKTGEDRRVQPMCFDQGEVLVLEQKSLGLKKEVCSKNQRLQITQRRDSKNVVIVTSVEIWLLTGDGKPRPEPDVSSIFKFRCIEEQDDLFILVEKSGIPIVYGTRPPDRNKDPAALYVVRMNFKRPNSSALEHVDFTLHKKQRSTAVGAGTSKKRTREEDAGHSNGPMMGNNIGNAALNHLMGVKKEGDPNGDSPMRVGIPQFQTLVHPQHQQHMGQHSQFHHQFPQSLPPHFPPILHQHPSLSAQHAQLQQAQLLAQQQYIAQLHAQQQFPLHPSVYGQTLSHPLGHPSLMHSPSHPSHSSLHNLPLVSFPPPSILQGQSPQQQQHQLQQMQLQHQQGQNQNPSSPHSHHQHGNSYESTREAINAESGQS